MKRSIEFIADAIKWRDKVNGNTYHSVKITRTEDGSVLHCPFTYGYGDSYKQTALEAMAKNRWLPETYTTPDEHGRTDKYAYERENGYPILWNVRDGLKRECIANGKKR